MNQVNTCQKTPMYRGHSISYMASNCYHEKRHKAGDRQQYCRVCRRWKYNKPRTVDGFSCEGDTFCGEAIKVPLGKCIMCAKKRPAKDEAYCKGCLEEMQSE